MRSYYAYKPVTPIKERLLTPLYGLDHLIYTFLGVGGKTWERKLIRSGPSDRRLRREKLVFRQASTTGAERGSYGLA